jgi:hypothetical protein
VPALPAEALERILDRTWELGLGDVPPGVVPYLTHPWVMANDKLKAAGWAPSHTNVDAINEAVATLPPRDHRPLVVMGVTAVATTVIVVSYRRRRRAG